MRLLCYAAALCLAAVPAAAAPAPTPKTMTNKEKIVGVWELVKADDGLLGGPVPVAPYMMSGSAEFGQLILDAMGQGNAVVWGNHGILVAGPSLKQALSMAHAVEDNAQAYLLAAELGEPRLLPDDEVARLHRFWLDDYGQRAIAEVDAGNLPAPAPGGRRRASRT